MTVRPADARDVDSELASVIESGARELAVELSAAQVELLVAYLHLIQRWNATYNLTAVRELPAMASQHVVDSLSIVPSLRRCLAALSASSVLDVGSGAGLPGVVIAIADPGVDVVCVDSVGKKASFITHVAASLGLKNLKAIHSRIEAVRAPPHFDVIVSRAFASLADFVGSTRHLLQFRGHWIAMKGKIPSDELAGMSDIGVDFDSLVVRVPHLAADRCLLIGQDIRESERKL